jgi:hypothetical protein
MKAIVVSKLMPTVYMPSGGSADDRVSRLNKPVRLFNCVETYQLV